MEKAFRSFALATAAAALWTGCASGAAPRLSPSEQGLARQTAARDLSVPRMDASGCSTSVIYVSSYNGDVQIYNQMGKNQTACGAITGFKNPQGVFVDAQSNVWIVDDTAKAIYEYPPGGGTPIQTLDDSGSFPFVVAVDNKSGTVYVTNSQNGDVDVFAKGSTTKTATLNESKSLAEFFDAVDDKGNLYVSYLESGSGAGKIDEWVGGTGSPVDLGITLGAPGGIQTTKSGALAACDQLKHQCGEFKTRNTNMVDLFAVSDGDTYALSLNKAETKAYVTDEGASVPNVGEWKYPGPDKKAIDTIAVTSGGENVAASPAAPEGKPLK